MFRLSEDAQNGLRKLGKDIRTLASRKPLPKNTYGTRTTSQLANTIFGSGLCVVIAYTVICILTNPQMFNENLLPVSFLGVFCLIGLWVFQRN